MELFMIYKISPSPFCQRGELESKQQEELKRMADRNFIRAAQKEKVMLDSRA
jgi:hypothetical protein